MPRFFGTLRYSHPITDEEFEVDYTGVDEPSTYHNPSFSELCLVGLPSELEPHIERIRDLCWVDYHENRLE